MTGPRLLPKKTTGTPRQVFLPKEMWERLKVAAKFHSDAFKELGSTEGVSRNDMIEEFLAWALNAYWEQVGGAPTEKNWEEKARSMALILEEQMQQKPKK